MKVLVRKRRLIVLLYSIYSYFSMLTWCVLNFSPQFVRRIFFRLTFKRFGQGGFIDYGCFVRYPWRVSIGNDVDINRGCELYPSMQTSEGLIVLDDNVVLGPGVIIFSSTHSYASLGLPDVSAPVKICRYVWVGGRSIILPGVVIGEGAVIGAGSVVTKDIPPYCVAVGNPARVIKRRVIEGNSGPI